MRIILIIATFFLSLPSFGRTTKINLKISDKTVFITGDSSSNRHGDKPYLNNHHDGVSLFAPNGFFLYSKHSFDRLSEFEYNYETNLDDDYYVNSRTFTAGLGFAF